MSKDKLEKRTELSVDDIKEKESIFALDEVVKCPRVCDCELKVGDVCGDFVVTVAEERGPNKRHIWMERR
jgi:hypothetical protein